ncbi:hypothetical protein [Rhodoferax sp. TS-BS-61-7]|uniref:hypothetical protein n=1 Tax=Rhodoferax sp. TS-BS-61-7 TaxID=2094194 RepID=UPI000CF621DF|nr:hypothetical protein [Rhodoferax sp. TS-BS-61-7]PQA78920.1 hypothetical protein C5F53_02850 [Rhodoferax sp. TS-BS-61-7]
MEVVGVVIGIAVVIGLFWIGRELLCWYWKINESLAMLTEVRTLMARSVKAQERIVDLLEAAQTMGNTSAQTDAAPGLPPMFPHN